MLLALILGILLGGAGVVFAMQNTDLITVSFLTWQFTAPLALILLSTMVLGIIVALLSLLPVAIRDALDAYAIRREQRRTEAAAREAALAQQNAVV